MPNIYIVIGIFIFLAYLLVVVSSGIETARNHNTGYLKTIILEFFQVFIALILIVLVHKVSRRTLKHLQQIGLYLLEIFVVCGIFLIIENWVYPIAEEHFWYDLFTRFIGVYVVYQIFVFSVLNLINSAAYDEWLALVRVIKLKQLYIETGEEYIKQKLDYLVDDALDLQTFMTGEPRKLMIEVNDCENLSRLKYYLILSEHQAQALSSYWHFSFLLNAIK